MNHFSNINKSEKQIQLILFICLGLVFALVPAGRVASLGLEGENTIRGTTGVSLDGNAPTAKIIYVDNDASSGGDGTSWAKAFQDLQDALTDADSGDEIWVAEGAYKPTSGSDRTATFQMENGVKIYGGFDGTENNRSERDWQANQTILSGDIDNNDSSVPANDTTDIVGDNSYHIVTGSGTNGSAVLDGFIISGGLASDAVILTCDAQCGAGIYNVSGSPKLNNLSIIGNDAPNVDGGGVYNASNSDPTLTNVAFTNNNAFHGGGMANVGSGPELTDVTFIGNTGFQGGGLYNVDRSSSTLTDVRFEGNHADNNGGGMFNRESQPHLIDVIFHRNDSDNNGGGMYSEFGESENIYPTLIGATFTGNSAAWGGGISAVNSDVVVINAIFSGNTAISEITDPEQGGGAIHNGNSDPTLTNVTISGNESNEDGGGIHNTNGDPIIQNSIIWDNEAPDGAEIFNDVSSQPTIRYSIVKGSGGSGSGWDTGLGTDGGHNIDADPKFVRNPSDGGDGWGDNPNTPGIDEGANDDYGDLRLQQGSPAIIAGNPQLDPDPNDIPPDSIDSMYDIPYDIIGNPRITGGTIEMGAYTFEGKAIQYLPIILKNS